MIEFTHFRKFNGSLTKVLSLSLTGEVRKDSAGCAMSTGSFVTLTIDHIRELPDILININELPDILINIKKSECLAYGVCSVQPEGRIISQDKAKPSDITRTKDTFIYKQVFISKDNPRCLCSTVTARPVSRHCPRTSG
jgi:hypothetical protein